MSRETTGDGSVTESLASGEWAVGVRLPGFKKADATVTLTESELCTIRAFLVLGDGADLVH
jgi:hypothetical protein